MSARTGGGKLISKKRMGVDKGREGVEKGREGAEMCGHPLRMTPYKNTVCAYDLTSAHLTDRFNGFGSHRQRLLIYSEGA